MSYIDLHLHSVVSSDGEFTPSQIVDRAKSLNMKLIAIADHDSVSAIDEEIKACKQNGIKYLSACEVSTMMPDKTELHVLGYNIDHQDTRFIQRQKMIHEIERKQSNVDIDAAYKLGFKFNKDEVLAIANDGVVPPELIGEVILSDHRNDNDERLLEYRNGGKKAANPGFNFYRDYYAYGKQCYNPGENTLLPLKQTAEWIHSAGGFMVLAHPAHNIKQDLNKLQEIIDAGLDGIEVFSSYHTNEDIAFFYKQAIDRDLIMTVGSDFHGHIKPATEIGSVDCDEDIVMNGIRRFVKEI